MMYTEYSELPLLLFLKIAKDEKRYMHLLRNGEKASNKKVRKLWEKFKDKWDENHPSSDWVKQRTLYKKCQTMRAKLNKQAFILKYILKSDIVPSEDFFKEAKIPYSTDLIKIASKLNKQIEKGTNQLEIYNAQYSALKKSMSEEQALEEVETNIYEAISSLSIASGIVRKHSEITIGEYEGDQKALERKNESLKNQSNGKR